MGTHRQILTSAHQKTGVISMCFVSIYLFKNTHASGIAERSGHGV